MRAYLTDAIIFKFVDIFNKYACCMSIQKNIAKNKKLLDEVREVKIGMRIFKTDYIRQPALVKA